MGKTLRRNNVAQKHNQWVFSHEKDQDSKSSFRGRLLSQFTLLLDCL